MATGKHLMSMTGFGRNQAEILPLGLVCLELKSINHKALEVLIHLPDGFSSLEARMKKEIEAKLKRGRVTCEMTISGGQAKRVFVNRELLREYFTSFKQIGRQFKIKDEVTVDALIHLPGVFSLVENRIDAQDIWPGLKRAVNRALDELVATRKKEGSALCAYLQAHIKQLSANLDLVKKRFDHAINERLKKITLDEERANFLKDTDITEEIERLAFHSKNLSNKLLTRGPVGKELDFIAQEMQREANTMSAQSFDMIISEKVIQIKSLVEKTREQLQNIE